MTFVYLKFIYRSDIKDLQDSHIKIHPYIHTYIQIPTSVESIHEREAEVIFCFVSFDCML